jgi:rhodanese-related sulfurtransferase
MPQKLRIEVIEAKSKVDECKAVILDVVSPMSRAHMRRQIAGAIRIAPEDFASKYKTFLPQDKQIIAYCT